MKNVDFPVGDAVNWDLYQAFHTFCMTNGFKGRNSVYGGPLSPLVLFDTGELICTSTTPGPHERGGYHPVGVSLTTTKNIDLFMPDGKPIIRAWLDDDGMQYLLHDWSSNRVVRLDGMCRFAAGSRGRTEIISPLTSGIPVRFQFNCRAYIPGPGLPPVSHEKIKLTIPIAKAGFSPDEIDHINMIIHTGQAAMKLTDHEAVRDAVKGIADPDVLLKCKTWQDVPPSMLPALLNGAPKRVVLCDYLATVPSGVEP